MIILLTAPFDKPPFLARFNTGTLVLWARHNSQKPIMSAQVISRQQTFIPDSFRALYFI